MSVCKLPAELFIACATGLLTLNPDLALTLRAGLDSDLISSSAAPGIPAGHAFQVGLAQHSFVGKKLDASANPRLNLFVAES